MNDVPLNQVEAMTLAARNVGVARALVVGLSVTFVVLQMWGAAVDTCQAFGA